VVQPSTVRINSSDTLFAGGAHRMSKIPLVLVLFPILILITGAGCLSTEALPKPQQTGSSSTTLNVSTVVSNLDTPWALDIAPDGRILSRSDREMCEL